MTEREDLRPADAGADARFVQHVKQELDRSCAALDGATQSRLNAMRHAVLTRAPRRSAALRSWLPFGGLATACVLVLTVLLQPVLQPAVQAPQQSLAASPELAAPIEDLDLLTAVDELDLYEEYEFYQWLAVGGQGN